MRRKIYTDRFGKIDLKKMLKHIKSYDELFSNKILEYNYHNELLKSRLDEIQYLKEQIKENEKEVVKINELCEKIYKENLHKIENYDMKLNVSKQNKKLSNGKVGIFWIINLKYKRSNKSIYLGSDKKVRKIVGEEIGNKKKLSDDRLRNEIIDICYDKLYNMVRKEDNLYNIKIRFEDLI